MQLEQCRIVITGGTSGIGYELVKNLYQTNQVIVIGRNEKKLQRLKQQFKNIACYQTDLSKRNEVETVANRIKQQFGVIDLLINNAAVQYTPTFMDNQFNCQSIYNEIEVNFTSVCVLTYLLLPTLLHERPAAIVNINSALALAPKTTSSIYCASKGALNIFSQSLRYQLEATNITVLQAFLPLVDTPMTAGRGHQKMPVQSAAKMILKGIEKGVLENDLDKVKWFRLLLRMSPTIARNIMKKY
ncbi:SDR family oxidoreductase [Catenovulum sediminis]|uniref:SDR family NAD(P)-dependent oxidoreductase n=1 Tax=Catenovulum sediminis TaxID=1740262 RepID=A0ABV1RJ73_9ALTE